MLRLLQLLANILILILILIPLMIANVRADTDGPSEPPAGGSFAGQLAMSGLHMSDFKDFAKNWHFVTVRFRKDTGEMRFVYANDKAWKSLSRGATDYAQGAVLAKIGVATHEDPDFASSSVPNGARRVQFMVRDREKFRTTDGWGYALFDANGKTFPDDPQVTVQACAACHRIVASHGNVFSRPINDFMLSRLASLHVSSIATFKFSDLVVSELPEALRAELPSQVRVVRALQGELRRNLFQGTLDELRPALAQESKRAKAPALILSEDGKRFSLVRRSTSTKCAAGLESFVGVTNVYLDPNNRKIEIHFCY